MLVGFQDLVATKEKEICLLVNVVSPENCSPKSAVIPIVFS